MRILKLTEPASSTRNEERLPSLSSTSSTSSFESVSPSEFQEETWSDDTETADTYSIFSSSRSESTRLTTPVNSDHGHSKGSDSSLPSSHVRAQRPSKRASYRKTTYTDEDWAKEVRWLVPPETSASLKSTRKKQKRPDSGMLARATPLPLSLPDPPTSVKSRMDKKGKGRMTAVLEVSEDEDADPSTYSRPSSFISYAHRNTRLRAGQHNLRVPSQQRSRLHSNGQQSLRRSKSKSLSPSRRHRPVTPSSIPVLASADAPSPPSRGMTPYSSLTLPMVSLLPPSHAVYSSSARNSRILDSGVAFLEKLRIEDSGKVDMTRSGMASTTMATIEVVTGSAEKLRGRGINRPFSWKSRSQFQTLKRPSSGTWDKAHTPTPLHLLYGTSSPLGFCSHRNPPTYVPSNHVLVQVWAVGLDIRDDVIVGQEKTGFIPGRSFAGRAVETGWEVPDDCVRKGEWVVGLTDLRKVRSS
jgi:hypothetical protein